MRFVQRALVLSTAFAAVLSAEEPSPSRTPIVLRLGRSRTLPVRYIDSFAVSPDGTRYAGGTPEAEVAIWDSETLEEVGRFKGLVDVVGAVVWSPDGKRLAAGDDGGVVQVFDVSGGGNVRLAGHADDISALAFSFDGSSLASGSEDGEIRIWDPRGGPARATLAGHRDKVRQVAFSPDGRRLASCGDDRRVRVWDPASGHLVAKLRGHQDEVRCLAWRPDGSALATACDDRTVRIWDSETWRTRVTFRNTEWARALAWSRDGKQLAVGVPERSIRILDADSGETLRELPFPYRGASVVFDLALALCGPADTLVCGAACGLVYRWSWADGAVSQPEAGHQSPIRWAAWSPDGLRVATWADGGGFLLWDAATGLEVGKVATGPGIAAHRWSPDGRNIAAIVLPHDGDSDVGSLVVYDAARQEAIEVPRLDSIAEFGWADDSEHLIVLRPRESPELVSRSTGTPARSLDMADEDPEGAGLVALAVSPDGRRVSVAGRGARSAFQIRVRDLESDRRLPDLGSQHDVERCAWTTDGRILLARGSERRFTLWEASTGLGFFRKRDLVLGSPDISPDGLHLAGIDHDRIVVSAIGSRTRTAVLRPPGNPCCLAWSPDGRRLLAGLEDGAAVAWDVSRLFPPPPPPDGEALDRLASSKPETAWSAAASLESAPGTATDLLEKTLSAPVAIAELPELEEIVRALDDDDPAVRRDAANRLAGFGLDEAQAIRRRLAGELPPEARAAIEGVLRSIDRKKSPSPAMRFRLRASMVLERIVRNRSGSADESVRRRARALLERLAADSPWDRVRQDAAGALSRLPR